MTPDEQRKLVNECGASVYTDKNCEDIIAFYSSDLAAYTAAVEAKERERCGEIANIKAGVVASQNTHRGRVSSAASFAVSLLEDVGMEIRSL